MARPLKEMIIDALIEAKHLKKEDVEWAVALQKQKGYGLDKALIERGLITESEFVVTLAKELNIPPIDLSKYKIDPELLSNIPERLARQYHVVPISKIGTVLTIALSDPFNIFALDDLRNLTGCEIDVALCADTEITKAINTFYAKSTLSFSDVAKDIEKGEGLTVLDQSGESFDTTSSIKESEQAPIVQIVNLVIKEALSRRASDIHLEPTETDMRIRYRIDGALAEILRVPKKNQNAILVRLKIMSRLDITEWRLPQDGRFKIKLSGKEVDFRVSVLPTTFGQKVVLRVLDKANLSIGLEGLGFFPETTVMFQEAIASPYGMILVTGPTGSGKSTTLYSIINQMNKPDRNIITIEDPVEYQIEGITQVQAKPEIGLTFANGLKSILRQNPDIILVGEIRDSETADIAVKASLTGQLVFSTLHTNDAAGAITRLIDMGVEPFLVSSSLVMACAQRLCRKVCQHCKEPYSVPQAVLDKIGVKADPANPFYHGRGCNNCNNTGYRGRMGILEILMIDDTIRDMIIKRTSSDEIKRHAIKDNGMKTVWDDIVRKFAAGLTTDEEVMRVAFAEE